MLMGTTPMLAVATTVLVAVLMTVTSALEALPT
jgi:hypothetical protein